MSHEQPSAARGAALALSAICLIAVGLSLTDPVDHRIVSDTESQQPQGSAAEPTLTEIPSAVLRDLNLPPAVRISALLSEHRPPMTRNQQLREYFEIRDSLELQSEMFEEFRPDLRPQLRIYTQPAAD